MSNGLSTTPTPMASRWVCRSSTSLTAAVQTTTGISRVSRSILSICRNCQPFLILNQEIEHQQIRPVRLDATQQLDHLDREAVGGDAVALVLEQGREQLQDGDGVVDDEDVLLFLIPRLCHACPRY